MFSERKYQWLIQSWTSLGDSSNNSRAKKLVTGQLTGHFMIVQWMWLLLTSCKELQKNHVAHLIPFGVNWFILVHVMGPQKCHLEGLLWGKSFSHNYNTISWYTYSADAVHPIHLAFSVSVPVISHRESYCHGLVQDTLAKKGHKLVCFHMLIA